MGYTADLCVVCADFMLQGGETLNANIPNYASKSLITCHCCMPISSSENRGIIKLKPLSLVHVGRLRR